ncbi:unnamed protein product [Closterium sp. NIES-65]|nr:unnamed protein product [Closterium sp. NIES-65]
MAVQSSPLDVTAKDASPPQPFGALRSTVATAVAAVVSAAAAFRDAAEAVPISVQEAAQQRHVEEERLETSFFDGVRSRASPSLLSLAAMSAAPLAIPIKSSLTAFFSNLRANPTFMSALIAWALAQILKVFTNLYFKKTFDIRMVVSSGGMPSSHTALCVAVTTSVALLHGVGGPLFPICLAFSSIIMYDATNVRYHAGVQAEVLNVVVEEMLEGHPISEKKLKELLGHTPLQVVGGFILGVVTAFVYHYKTGQILPTHPPLLLSLPSSSPPPSHRTHLPPSTTLTPPPSPPSPVCLPPFPSPRFPFPPSPSLHNLPPPPTAAFPSDVGPVNCINRHQLSSPLPTPPIFTPPISLPPPLHFHQDVGPVTCINRHLSPLPSPLSLPPLPSSPPLSPSPLLSPPPTSACISIRMGIIGSLLPTFPPLQSLPLLGVSLAACHVSSASVRFQAIPLPEDDAEQTLSRYSSGKNRTDEDSVINLDGVDPALTARVTKYDVLILQTAAHWQAKPNKWRRYFVDGQGRLVFTERQYIAAFEPSNQAIVTLLHLSDPDTSPAARTPVPFFRSAPAPSFSPPP